MPKIIRILAKLGIKYNKWKDTNQTEIFLNRTKKRGKNRWKIIWRESITNHNFQ